MEKQGIAQKAELTRREHMATDIFQHYKAWRKVLHERINNQGLPLMERPDKKREELAINRQVALAILSDLEYNFRKQRSEISILTSKSAVYWNFMLLGTTVKKDGGRKVREEQKTSDYFIATTLNALEEHDVKLDWKKLGFILEQARWRVIAEPADVEKREQWRLQCGGECVEPGINYPAPWHVANWAGDQVLGTEDLLILGFSGYKETTQNPGRIKRLDIACFQEDGTASMASGSPERRPTILKGLGKRMLKKKDVVGAEFEELLEKTMRKVNPMLNQEIDRRIKAELKVKQLQSELFALEARLANADLELREIDLLREENKQMKKWGSEMKKRLEQINTLSWLQDVARKLPKD